MMKWRKTGIAATALLAVGVMALSAAAQQQGDKPVTTTKENADTIKLHVSGKLNLDYVYRSQELTGFIGGFTGGLPGISFTNPESETTVEGMAGIRFDAELSDKISAVVEVGTRRVDGGGTTYYGAGGGAVPVGIREANLSVSEFLMQESKLQVGYTNWAFDVRGKGSAMAFDPRHSSSITKNMMNGTIEDTVGLDTAGFFGVGARGGPSFNLKDELDAVGAVWTYSRENITFDVVALPAVVEVGAASRDEALYAADLWYNLDSMGKGSRFGVIVALSSWDFEPRTGAGGTVSGHNTAMFTIGGGVDLKNVGGMQGIEVYAEAYFQTGDAGKADTNGDGQPDDLKAGGKAFQLGLEYHLPNNPMNVWFGVNYTYVSGDGDDAATSTDDTFDTFVSYESIGDLMIVEDMYWGLDWDTNYTAFKISGGASFGSKKEFDLKAVVGFLTTAEDVDYTTTIVGGSAEDKLGTEVDVRITWNLSKQASLSAAAAFLTGSDILEQSMGGSGNPDAEDSATLYEVGFDVKF
jgi:hypothetical protein